MPIHIPVLLENADDVAAFLGVASGKILDARTIPCASKHSIIFMRWAQTAVGDFFILLNDHRPLPLKAQFKQMAEGAFAWTECVSQPGFFGVRIARLAPDPTGSSLGEGDDVESDSRFQEGILAWIEIDATEASPDEGVARIERLARFIQPWTGLIATFATALPEGIGQLSATGMDAREEPLENGSVRYRLCPPRLAEECGQVRA